jgi:predicted dehydrogenase
VADRVDGVREPDEATPPGSAGRPLRVGIAGAGWVAGARHIPAYRRDRRVTVTAIYDRYPERAATLARRFGIEHVCTTTDEFFVQGLDIVSVCTSPWTHAKLAIDSLEHGCHVLVEKPMALSTAEAESMVRAAAQAERRLCVSHNFLFSRSMLRVKELMQRGVVGPIRHVMAVQASSPHRRLPEWYPRLRGGLFFDESPHMVYLLQHFLGEIAVEGVRAQTAPPERAQPLDVIEASLRGNGITASLSMVFTAPVSEWYIVVFGERRVLTIDIFRDILTEAKPDGRHALRDVIAGSLDLYWQQARGFAATGLHFLTNRARFGQDTLTRHFIDSALGLAPPPVTTDQALSVLRTMEAILDNIPALADRQPLTVS